MKTKTIILTICLISTTFGWSQENLRETIDKAKKNLLEVLERSEGQFNFGLEMSQVRSANPAQPIQFTDMEFENLLKYDQGKIDKLLKPTYKLVVPMINSGRVITTISVAEKEQRYEVIELISQKYTKDLNDLPIAKDDGGFRDLTIINVPNLNVLIYKLGEKIFTEYGGRSLKEGVDTQQVMLELKKDAEAFVKQYGRRIEVGTLVD
ncbi:MAG: hypothetical protein WBG71_04070 [Leeuwenhoekiella sp.]